MWRTACPFDDCGGMLQVLMKPACAVWLCMTLIEVRITYPCLINQVKCVNVENRLSYFSCLYTSLIQPVPNL